MFCVSRLSRSSFHTRAPRLHRRHLKPLPPPPPPPSSATCWRCRACCSHAVCTAVSVLLVRSSHADFMCIFPTPLPQPPTPSSVCRNISKQTFLETLQDNLIEMDILASAGHDAAYNDGYVACCPYTPPPPAFSLSPFLRRLMLLVSALLCYCEQ